jgi:hypothetical protein
MILCLSLSFLLLPLWSVGHPWNALFHFSFIIIKTVGRTPWTGDQPVASRYLHIHRINAHTDIHASSGIRTDDPSVRANVDASCLRPRGQRNRFKLYLCFLRVGHPEAKCGDRRQRFWLVLERYPVQIFSAIPAGWLWFFVGLLVLSGLIPGLSVEITHDHVFCSPLEFGEHGRPSTSLD